MKKSFAVVMQSCCRFTSLVEVSISDPELRFVNMVLSSAISNGLANSFSKIATKIDLRGSDYRIYEVHVHICSKEFNFWACQPFPWSTYWLHHCHIIVRRESFSTTQGFGILIQWCSPRWSTAVWKLYLDCDRTEKMISLPLCSESVSYLMYIPAAISGMVVLVGGKVEG